MPVAESEIVTGYMTEYSGIRFLLFFIGEFATAGAFAAIAATMFLGGWAVPFVDLDDNLLNIVGPLVLFAKMMPVGLLTFVVRIPFPRFRGEEIQAFPWKT